MIPLIHARRAHAEQAEQRIKAAAMIAGITAEFHIVQDSYPNARDLLAAAVRLNDIAIHKPYGSRSRGLNAPESMG
jgi:hypothetical protein